MTHFYGNYGKRCCDIAVLIALSPVVTPLIAVLYALSLVLVGHPVFFRQLRAGRNARPFTLLKFRSMRDLRDASGKLLPDDQRVTPYGRFIRSLSLDELPELWNVLKGDMSLIGPRPLPVGYEKHYTAAQATRLRVRPGLAGYAALFGRNAQPWEQILERDAWYVRHICLWLDVSIVFRLIPVVLSRSGIDRGKHDQGSAFAEKLRRSMDDSVACPKLRRLH